MRSRINSGAGAKRRPTALVVSSAEQMGLALVETWTGADPSPQPHRRSLAPRRPSLRGASLALTTFRRSGGRSADVKLSERPTPAAMAARSRCRRSGRPRCVQTRERTARRRRRWLRLPRRQRRAIRWSRSRLIRSRILAVQTINADAAFVLRQTLAPHMKRKGAAACERRHVQGAENAFIANSGPLATMWMFATAKLNHRRGRNYNDQDIRRNRPWRLIVLRRSPPWRSPRRHSPRGGRRLSQPASAPQPQRAKERARAGAEHMRMMRQGHPVPKS